MPNQRALVLTSVLSFRFSLPAVTASPQAQSRSTVLFVVLCAVGASVAWKGSAALAGSTVPAAACACAEGADVDELRRRLELAWGKAFDGERPDDGDLAAYQDAIEVLDCLSANEVGEP